MSLLVSVSYVSERIYMNGRYRTRTCDLTGVITGKKKRYTRRGVNDTLNRIHKMWKWGMGHQLVTAEQVQGLQEAKSLRTRQSQALHQVTFL